jgi:hypothetical protein
VRNRQDRARGELEPLRDRKQLIARLCRHVFSLAPEQPVRRGVISRGPVRSGADRGG